MANILARQFLSDVGFKQLERSEGAVNVVHKKIKIGELENIISKLNAYIGRNDKKIAKKESKIAEIEGISFLKKILSFGKFKRERNAIQEQIGAIQEQNDGYDISIKNAEYEIVVLENDIKAYAKKLESFGLTVDDIMAEYNVIVAELKLRENKKKPTIVNVAEEELASVTVPANLSNQARQTPLQKFQARQAKHEQIVKQKGE